MLVENMVQAGDDTELHLVWMVYIFYFDDSKPL